MFEFIFQSIWFILPSYIANVAPALVKNVSFLNSPVDFNKSFKGKRIFGDHKTWRGLFFGILAALLLSMIQGHGYYVGFVLGTGTLAGDLIGSFIKRRMKLSPGDKNLLIDELPGTVTALIFAYLLNLLPINIYQVVFLVIIGLPIHILANILWYKLKLKEVPW